MNLEPMDWIGIAGGVVLLLSFWRTSIGKWTGKSLWYELDNFAAAALLLVYSFSKGAFVNVILNGAWAVVAFRGMTSYAERRAQGSRKQQGS